MKKSINLILLTLLCFSTSSQVNLDSLWGVWNSPKQPDSNKLKAMNKISWDGYMFSKPDSAFYFQTLRYNLAQEIDDKKVMAHALNAQGVSFSNQENYPQAIDHYLRSLEIGYKKGMASTQHNLAVTYRFQGDYAKAIQYAMQSLKISEEIGDRISVANSLTNIGIIYSNLGDESKSVDYYNKAIKIYEEIGFKQGMAQCLSNIGASYSSNGNLQKGLEYYLNSLKIYEEIGDKNNISGPLVNIGSTYQEQGKHAKAIDYLKRALIIDEEHGDKQGIAISLTCIGIVYKNQENYAKAIEYLSKALDIAKNAGFIITIRDAAHELYEVNKKLGKNKQALEMYELYVTTKDSITSEENEREVIRQEYKYEYEKQATADSVKAAEAQKVASAQIMAQEAELKKEKVQRYALFGGVILLVLFGGFMYNRFKLTRQQRDVIEEQKDEVEKSHELLTEKNREILDSIDYAKRIQNAILPPKKMVKEYLGNSFILYKPKDVVAGDFYWMENSGKVVYFAAADCTGHGVPGAMVSVICVNGLNRSLREFGLKDPGAILDKTRELVIQEFEKSEEEVQDGMDISLCALNTETKELMWSGAHNPLWIVRKDADIIEEIKADKQPIGKFELAKPFTTHTIKLNDGDTIYAFSDGYPDQFGGELGKKYKSGKFKQTLVNFAKKEIHKQSELLDCEFESWRGDLEQVDDVCVIGVVI